MVKNIGRPANPAAAGVPDTRDPKVLKAAQMYETQFLREMVRAMRKTVNESELVKTNMAEKIFREQLDDEYVDSWVNVRGGVGLSDMIYNQIVDRYGQQLGIKKPLGPTPLGHDQMLKVKSKGMPIKIEGPQSSLHSPWQGKVEASFKTPEGKQMVKISHLDGLESIFSFAGEVPDNIVGQQIEAGEIFGKTLGTNALLEWTLRPSGLVQG